MRNTAHQGAVEQPAVQLIVNADDLGMSAGVNAGIFEAHASGIVTSASLMVLRPAAVASAQAVSGFAALSVGLHIEIEGDVDAQAAERECREQLAAFRELLGGDPTHIDSHHHVHTREPVLRAARRLASRLDVPLRGGRIPYEGGFFARTPAGDPWPGGIAVERLCRLIESLPAGWTELGCHPGIGVGEESSYGREREQELRVLCDPRVRATIASAGVRLRSFSHVR